MPTRTLAARIRDAARSTENQETVDALRQAEAQEARRAATRELMEALESFGRELEVVTVTTGNNASLSLTWRTRTLTFQPDFEAGHVVAGELEILRESEEWILRVSPLLDLPLFDAGLEHLMVEALGIPVATADAEPLPSEPEVAPEPAEAASGDDGDGAPTDPEGDTPGTGTRGLASPPEKKRRHREDKREDRANDRGAFTSEMDRRADGNRLTPGSRVRDLDDDWF